MIRTLVQKSLALAVILVPAAVANGQGLIAYDGFDYGPTPNLQFANGGTGWASQWFKLSTIPTGVASGGLAWPHLQTGGNSAVTAPYQNPDFTRYSRAIAPYTDPDDTIYISFLLCANAGYGVNGGLAFGTWDNGMVVGTRPSGLYGLMVPNNSLSADTKIPVIQGETKLFVARVDKNADGTITWSMFVNPALGNPEPQFADATLTIAGAALPQALMIYNDGGFSTDEIRVGHDWSSVLPVDVIAGDVNHDRAVNVSDLLAVIVQWGPCPSPPQPCAADVAPFPNGDGQVNVNDLLMVINHWG